MGVKGDDILSRWFQNESGVTLTEIVVAIVLISLIAAAFIPMIGVSVKNIREISSKNKMIAEYRAALEIYLAYGEDIKSDSVEIIKETTSVPIKINGNNLEWIDGHIIKVVELDRSTRSKEKLITFIGETNGNK